MKKLMIGVCAGLALCLFANVARAADLVGVYTYKLVLRDDLGFVLSGCETDEWDERVTSNFTLEVYNSNREKLNVNVKDVAVGAQGSDYNCAVEVPVGADGVGCAKVGEQLTLVVYDKIVFDESSDGMRFWSSKVLPPVGGFFGVAPASVGVFRADAGDVDYGYDYWLWVVELFAETEIGCPDDDADEDGLPNLREYQLGTDPLGGYLGLRNTQEFTLTEQDDGYVVEFNFDYRHVYSVRAIEGAAGGRNGLGVDLELYDADDHEVSRGKFVYEPDDCGTRRFFVRKPTTAGSIDLAVDGRLLTPPPVGPTVTLPADPTGYSYVVSNETAGAAVWGRSADDKCAYAVPTGDVVTVYFKLKPGYVFVSGGDPKNLGAITEDKTVTADELPKALALMGVAAYPAAKTYDGEATNIAYVVTNYLGEAITDATICLREPLGTWVAAAEFAAYVDVTNATVEVKAEKTGYTTATNAVTVAILPRAVTLTSATDSWTYDGLAHSNASVTVGGAGFVAGDGVGTNGFATITNVGTVPNAFSYAFHEGTKAENYSVSCVTGTLTVTAMPVGESVTMAAAGDGIYNGLGHEPQPAVSNAVLGVELAAGADFDYVWESNTNAGTAKVIAVLKGNYTGALTNEFAINRATLSPLSGFGTTNVYDGVAHTIDTNALEQAYADKFLGNVPSFGYALQSNGTYGAVAPAFTDVTVTSVWYKVSAANFEDVIHSAKVIVTNRCVTLTSGSETWIYDGLAHSNTTVTVGGAGFVAGEGVTTNGFPTITDVGIIPNAFSYAFLDGTEAANYNVTCVTGTLAVGGYRVSYDGNGAAGSMEEDLFITDMPTNLTANAYTAVGYAFKGWTTNGVDVAYTNRADGVNFVGIGETLTLKALWDDTGVTVTTFAALTNALVTATNQTLAVRVNLNGEIGVPQGVVVRVYDGPSVAFEGAGKFDVSGIVPQFGQPAVVGEGFAEADLALFDVKGVSKPVFDPEGGKVVLFARGESEAFPWVIDETNGVTAWVDKALTNLTAVVIDNGLPAATNTIDLVALTNNLAIYGYEPALTPLNALLKVADGEGTVYLKPVEWIGESGTYATLEAALAASETAVVPNLVTEGAPAAIAEKGTGADGETYTAVVRNVPETDVINPVKAIYAEGLLDLATNENANVVLLVVATNRTEVAPADAESLAYANTNGVADVIGYTADYVDMTLSFGGVPQSEIDEAIAIHVPWAINPRQVYRVSRIHEGLPEALPAGAENAVGGEYFEVFADKIVIHSKKFSLYAIGEITLQRRCTIVVGNGGKTLGEEDPSSIATNFTVSVQGLDINSEDVRGYCVRAKGEAAGEYAVNFRFTRIPDGFSESDIAVIPGTFTITAGEDILEKWADEDARAGYPTNGYVHVRLGCDAAMGKVKGEKVYKLNAKTGSVKVSIGATPAKDYVFAGWYLDPGFSQPAMFWTGSGKNAKPKDYREASQSITATDNVYLFARFVKKSTTADPISWLRYSGAGYCGADASVFATNEVWYQGVALPTNACQIAFGSLSLPTVSASGLPSGVKFDKTTLRFTGVPTAASTAKKPFFTVKVTVKNKSGATDILVKNIRVEPLPAWAVGTFDGYHLEEGVTNGTFTATVGKTGKVSGKTKGGYADTTFSAKNFSEVFTLDGSNLVYAVDVTVSYKDPKTRKTVKDTDTLYLMENQETRLGVIGGGDEDGCGSVGVQRAWDRKDLDFPAFATGKSAPFVELENGLMLKFGAKGKVTIGGTVNGVKVSGTTYVLPTAWQSTMTVNLLAQVPVYVAPKKGFDGFCAVYDVLLTTNADGKFDEASL